MCAGADCHRLLVQERKAESTGGKGSNETSCLHLELDPTVKEAGRYGEFSGLVFS